MTLPNLQPVEHIIRPDERGLHSVRVFVLDGMIQIGVENGCSRSGVELSPWDADALATMLRLSVTEALFDVPAAL